jgi:hypothetical protein
MASPSSSNQEFHTFLHMEIMSKLGQFIAAGLESTEESVEDRMAITGRIQKRNDRIEEEEQSEKHDTGCSDLNN